MKENKLKKLNYELLKLYEKSLPILIRSWKEMNNTPIPKEKKKLIDKMFR